MTYKTEQEAFWAGEFGNNYIDRNDDQYKILPTDTFLFSQILKNTSGIKSVIEFGSNIGYNLIAIKRLLPILDVSAVEINTKAVEILKRRFDNNIKVYNQSILDFNIDGKRDLVLVKGVLIHINPDELKDVYRKIYESSKKYIIVCEYYNPQPIEVNYRGNTGKLFKRDFAGEILDQYKDLELIDYGFVYHRDKIFPGDDFTWFLLKKQM
jgi:spore coat polysaccharide biosynthesis protein SpsF